MYAYFTWTSTAHFFVSQAIKAHCFFIFFFMFPFCRPDYTMAFPSQDHYAASK